MHAKAVPMGAIRSQVLLLLAFALAALAAGCGGAASSKPGGEDGTEAGLSAAGAFTDAASMNQARQAHTATKLADGRVLVTGGRIQAERGTGDYGGGSGPSRYSSAEIYDPSTGTWSSAGSMSEPRAFHTATLLQDGRVLVAGDRGKKTLPDIFDPSSGTWSVAGEMVVPRGEHTATRLDDGKVLVTGGVNSFLMHRSSAEIYDPVTDIWSETGSMTDDRSNHTATLLPDGRVLAIGSGASLKFLLTAELFDPASGTWTAASPMAEGRAYHTATPLGEGRVLVVGADEKTSAEIYHAATGTWSSAGNAVETRAYHTATLLPDGRVLVAGGSVGVFVEHAEARSSAEVYDPPTNTWSSAGSMSFGRYRFTATMLEDGKVLLSAGQDGDEVTNSVELFSP